jgi:hypothetical protein
LALRGEIFGSGALIFISGAQLTYPGALILLHLGTDQSFLLRLPA